MKTDYYGVIYKITNLVNGKIYIGQTKQKPKNRWSQHKYNSKNKKIRGYSLIAKAIYKYGVDNFIFEEIDYAKTPEELNLLEEKYIEYYSSISPNGYNILNYENGIRIIQDHYLETMSKKQINKKREGSSSKYFGVSFISKENKWSSLITYKGKNFYIGCFNTEEDAAKARDLESLKSEYEGLFELNFPELKEFYISGEINIQKREILQQNKKKKENCSSIYKGVSFRNKNNKWSCYITYQNKRYYIGEFDNEEDAAKKYDIKAIDLLGENAVLNFEELRQDYLNKTVKLKGSKKIIGTIKRKNSSSKYMGVYFHKQSNRWRAEFVYDGNKKCLGNFKEEINAAKAYDIQALRIYGIDCNLNFPELKQEYLMTIQ